MKESTKWSILAVLSCLLYLPEIYIAKVIQVNTMPVGIQAFISLFIVVAPPIHYWVL